MATKVQPQTVQIETLVIGKDKAKNANDLAKVLGRPLGSPINGKDVGETFTATLTGSIQISEYAGRKSAHFVTKEGYKVAVNASFDPAKHKADAIFTCICREIAVQRDGQEIKIKFAAFVD